MIDINADLDPPRKQIFTPGQPSTAVCTSVYTISTPKQTGNKTYLGGGAGDISCYGLTCFIVNFI
jgi:hypothetical protein